MRIDSVRANNHARAIEVVAGGRVHSFPYAKAAPPPSREDPLVELVVDEELGGEAVTYRLESGSAGTIHLEQVLEYNRDPAYMRDLLLYRLTVAAREAIEESPLSRREVARRLSTSPAQLYRLLDTTNHRKSVDRLLELLQVLDRDVDLVVSPKGGQSLGRCLLETPRGRPPGGEAQRGGRC